MKDFYKKLLDHARSTHGNTISIRDLVKNYRNGKGLALTRLGVLTLISLGVEHETFNLNRSLKFTAQLRILFEKYNQYPYYIDKNSIVLFGTEDRLLYKMYGSDIDAWVAHMSENYQRD